MRDEPFQQPGPLARDLIADNFGIESGTLTIGGIGVDLLARQFGTPLFVYDADAMRARYRCLAETLDGFAEIYFSIKANPNPAVAAIFVAEGAGLEIASGTEFMLARRAGCAPARILFAGPGKGRDELELCIDAGIGEIHVETFEEIAHIGAIAQRLGRTVPVAIRINPVASAQGGAMRMGGKPAGFGFDEEILDEVIAAIAAQPNLEMSGVHLFAGTQILDAKVLVGQWRHGLDLAARVAGKTGRPLRTIDLGGGLGVPYHDGDTALDLATVRDAIPALTRMLATNPLLADANVIVEPGRFLTAQAGVYVTSVRAVKISRGARFVITDGGMNQHLAASGNLGQIIKRDYPILAATRLATPIEGYASVIGPLCTPLDTLGRKVALPSLTEGDLVAVLQSGAYGLSASPVGFLGHPMPAEILIDNGAPRQIRPRGTFETPLTSPA